MISRLPRRSASMPAKRMTVVTMTVTSIVSVLLAVILQIPAGAQELSTKELKKAVRQADKAFAGGSYGEAFELYEQIRASTSDTDPRRGDALYPLAVIRMSPNAGYHDIEQARRHLDELAAFPRHPRRLEIAALRALFAERDSARAEVKGRIDNLDAKLVAFEEARERAEAERQEAAGENEAAADDRLRSVESRLSKARGELSECQAELEEKEEALQKLRDALVGGGS